MGKSVLLFLLLSAFSFSQTLLLEENFDYGETGGDLLTVSSGNWTAHDAEGSNPVQYLSTGLTYSNYPSITGGSASISGGSGSREDVNIGFVEVNSGSLFISFLINVTDATTGGGDYNFHLNSSTSNGRLYLKQLASSIAFGISKRDAATFTDFIYSLNTTYTIVIKYNFVSGSSNDDIFLFIFDGNIPETEPSPTITHPTESTTDPSSINSVALRQGTISNSFIIDGIRVADSWQQAPLPVELSSFTGSVINNQILLNWKTATEINNYGFEVERNEDKGEYHTIGFVKGSGNSNSEKEYDFIDNGVSFAGKYQYRLKQIDTDGSFNYSGVVEVSLTAPLKYNLSQNYPNPFNPVTVINYTIPEAGKVKVFLYNIIGETVLTLVDEFKEAGTYYVVLNGRGLRSGTYFYKLQTKNFTEIKKMIILK